jgi:hypothetical protein
LADFSPPCSTLDDALHLDFRPKQFERLFEFWLGLALADPEKPKQFERLFKFCAFSAPFFAMVLPVGLSLIAASL